MLQACIVVVVAIKANKQQTTVRIGTEPIAADRAIGVPPPATTLRQSWWSHVGRQLLGSGIQAFLVHVSYFTRVKMTPGYASNALQAEAGDQRSWGMRLRNLVNAQNTGMGNFRTGLGAYSQPAGRAGYGLSTLERSYGDGLRELIEMFRRAHY